MPIASDTSIANNTLTGFVQPVIQKFIMNIRIGVRSSDKQHPFVAKIIASYEH